MHKWENNMHQNSNNAFLCKRKLGKKKPFKTKYSSTGEWINKS